MDDRQLHACLDRVGASRPARADAASLRKLQPQPVDKVVQPRRGGFGIVLDRVPCVRSS